MTLIRYELHAHAHEKRKMGKLKVLAGISVGSITFGSDKSMLLAVMGKPSVELARRGIKSLVYESCVVLLENEKVVEVSVKDFTNIDLFGINLASMTPKEALDVLYSLDTNVYESLGFLVFSDLCISLTGFNDLDEDASDRAINFFSKGRWDSQLEHMNKQFGL
jgi:hypothetical protein